MTDVPWGTVPGRGVLVGYLNETLVHGWDLAAATGQPWETDQQLAETVLSMFRQALPAGIRGDDGIPFEPVVEPRPGAGATERLANWSGRESASWMTTSS